MWYSAVEFHFLPAWPRAMPSASQDRFRQSWKLQELSGKPAQAWLIVRRTVATLLAIGLIGVLRLVDLQLVLGAEVLSGVLVGRAPTSRSAPDR